MDTPSPDPLLDETQAAALMSVSPRTLQAWRARGGGPAFVRVGSRIRYCPRALAAWFRVRSATTATPRKARPVTLSHRPALSARMVTLIADEMNRGFAGEVHVGAAAYRRLSRALRPHEAALARALCRDSMVQPDGIVRLNAPRNFCTDEFDCARAAVAIEYDPRSGRWTSETSAGEPGFDNLCAHVWHLAGRRDGLAARDLLAFIGAAYLALLSERDAA